MEKRVSWSFGFILILSGFIFGQSNPNFEREQQEANRQAQEKQQSLYENDLRYIRESRAETGEKARRAYKLLTKEETAALNAARAVNPEDLAQYKDFLKQSKTGIFRLFPDLGCGQKLTVKVDGICANAVPDSSSYSFRQKDYSGENLFDITLKDGKIFGNGFIEQSILVNFGRTPLAEISEKTNLGFLSQFKPEKKYGEVKKQSSQISAGINADNYLYSKQIKVEENTIYAARLIAYQIPKEIFQDENLQLGIDTNALLRDIDKRNDLTVVFQVVRIDTDGSVTIIWKKIAQKNAPELKLEAGDKF